jgi:exodeoxyribonuclease V beta subunit
MTAAAHDAWVGSEPEEPLDLDEPDEPTPTPGGDEAPGAVRRLSTWQSLPVGVGFGTAVHRVLEAADFTAPDLGAELAPVIPDGAGDPDVLVQSLHEAIETPLGPLLGDRRLRDLRREDRLDELQFELPIAGGDDPVGQLTVAGLASVLRERLEPSDPLFGYAERLDDPALRSAVRGYLTGSIDLVLRIGARFAIVDYKTNWLGPPEVDLLLWHYRPDALKAEMLRAHYGLQAILYSAALHRYLRWRVPGYSPDEHLAGVFYLFLRGMAGADTPTVGGQPCGVFAWRPPSGLVEAVSQVLDEGAVS